MKLGCKTYAFGGLVVALIVVSAVTITFLRRYLVSENEAIAVLDLPGLPDGLFFRSRKDFDTYANTRYGRVAELDYVWDFPAGSGDPERDQMTDDGIIGRLRDVISGNDPGAAIGESGETRNRYGRFLWLKFKENCVKFFQPFDGSRLLSGHYCGTATVQEVADAVVLRWP